MLCVCMYVYIHIYDCMYGCLQKCSALDIYQYKVWSMCIVGRFWFWRTSLGAIKSLTFSDRKIFVVNISKILHVYPHYSGGKFSSGTLPTMH